MADSEGHLVLPDNTAFKRTQSVEERLGGKAPDRGADMAPEKPLPIPGEGAKNGKSSTELDASVLQEIDDLKQRNAASDAAVADANRRAAEAEAQRRQAVEEAAKARTTANDAELGSVGKQIEGRTARRESLKAELKTALSELNYDRAAEINVELADISAELRDLTRSKGEIEARKTAAPKPEDQRQQPTKYQTWDDAVAYDPAYRESFLRSTLPRAQQWLRDHPQVFETPQAAAALRAAGQLALAKGLQSETDAYFSFIGKAVGIEDGGGEDNRPAPKPRVERKNTPPAAPPSRDSSPTVGGKPMQLRSGDKYIPPAMKEFAERMFPGKTEAETKANVESYYDTYVSEVQAQKITDQWGIFRS